MNNQRQLIILLLLVTAVQLAQPTYAKGQKSHMDQPSSAPQQYQTDTHIDHQTPHILAAGPFVILLLCIAILPVSHKTEHWWHRNKNKLTISIILATA